MIKFMLYLLIVGLFILDWLFLKHGIGIRQMTWLPEFISILIAISLPFRTAIKKEGSVPIKYFFLLFLYLAHIGSGFLFNDVTGWTMLSGLRIYTKFIPIFLVVIIFPLTEQEFKKIVLLVFVLAMVQFPVVLWQRFVSYATSLSGDPMGGTLGHSASGVLSIFLLIILSFLVAFYFKEQISLPKFLIALALAFIPTTLNETKITFLLLPVAFVFSAFFIKAKRQTIFRVMLVLCVFVVSFFVFRGIYNYYYNLRYGYSIETFLAMPGRVQRYNSTRIDPMKYAFVYGMKDFRFVVFGHGAGNVSEGFTRKLNGKYVQEGIYYGVGDVSFTKMIWELGLLGTILFFLFPFFVFLDSASMSRKPGFEGAFSLGMVNFAVFFFLSMFYTFTMDSNLLIYLFFLTAGYIVHRRHVEVDNPDNIVQFEQANEHYMEKMASVKSY